MWPALFSHNLRGRSAGIVPVDETTRLGRIGCDHLHRLKSSLVGLWFRRSEVGDGVSRCVLS
jgi:hypothetical protein